MSASVGPAGILSSPLRVSDKLWNSVYLDAAVARLRAEGYPVREEDLARLSPYIRKHINVQGHYFFELSDLRGGHRPLRDPDAPDEPLD